MERFQKMEDFTRLEIGLSHIAHDRYKVELRFWRPNDQVEYAPVSGIAQFTLADFLWELSPDTYGQLLCEQLFADARVLERFKEASAVTEDRNTTIRVRLWIDATASSLQQLHWETLHNPLTHTSLLTNERSLFSRLLGSSDLRSVSLRAREDMRALIVIANPRNLAHYQLAPLESSSELAHAQKSLELFSTDALVSDASHVGRVTLTNVIAQLGKDYDILYLVCHGALRDQEGHGQLEPYLWLENENGDAQIVSGRDFVTRLRDLSTSPKLIFLASCQSVNHEHAMLLANDGVLPALGPQLVQMGIPAVVGMQGNISSETTSRFSAEFFRELHRDGQVERAMAVARRTTLMFKRSDWWMPVLFHRLKDGHLWFKDERSKQLFALLADHSSFLNDRLNSFVGRAAELTEIKAHIQQRLRTGGYVTITGQAGQGKSSIIAKLVDEYSKERYAFHFIPFNPGPDHQVGLLRNLMAHLILKYNLSELYVASESRPALRDYFPKVLSEVVAKGGHEVIFIDGLDQLEEDATGVRDLSFLPRDTPPGVVFVLGTRPNDTLRPLELLKPHSAYPLPNLSRHDFDLILQYRNVRLSPDITHKFYDTMQANALFLDLVAQELKELTTTGEAIAPEKMIEKLANNPANLFSYALERLERSPEWETIEQVLGFLLASREPLSLQQLRHLLGVKEYRLRSAMVQLGGLITESTPKGQQEQRRYSLFHLMFQDFLGQNEYKYDSQKESFFARNEVEHYHHVLAKWCEGEQLALIWRETKDQAEQERRAYACQHYLAHLYYARQWPTLFSILDAGNFGHAKLAHDPSMRSYALDLTWGQRAATWEDYSFEQGIDCLSILWRYSLLRCRLASRADSYPDQAFEAMILLDQSVKALGIAELLTNPVRKVRVLLLMARLLAERSDQQQVAVQLVKRATLVASLIESDPEKDEALSDLASSLAQVQQYQEAERVIASIQDSYMQAQALSDLARVLAEDQQWQEAERVIASIQGKDMQAWALSDLASTLAEGMQWQEAERVIASIPNNDMQVWALSDLASTLAEAGNREAAQQLWQKAERVIAANQGSDTQAWTLSALASSLAEGQQWQEAERVIASIQDNDPQEWALSALASCLAEGHQWQKAQRIIASIQDSDRKAQALSDLASSLAQIQQWPEAERIIATIPNSNTQARALSTLASTLTQAGDHKAAERLWQKAERVIAAIPNSNMQTGALSDLASSLAQVQQWQEAERIIASIQDSSTQAWALSDLASTLAEAGGREAAQRLWQEAERVIAANQRSDTQAQAVRDLASSLVQVQQYQEAERIIASIQDSDRKAQALSDLASSLAQVQQYQEAERVIASIPNSYTQAWALSTLASSLAEGQQWPEAERVIASIPNSHAQACALRDLASSLVQVQQWQEAERAIASIQDSDMQDGAVSNLASSLVQVQQWQEAERVIASIPKSYRQSGTLSTLTGSLAKALQWQEAERIITSIQDSYTQARALSDLASSLTLASDRAAAERLWQKAERVITSIPKSNMQARALSTLASSLAKTQQWQEAERVIATIQDSDMQAQALSALAGSLTQAGDREAAERYWQEAENVIASIQGSNGKARALSTLASSLVQVQQWQAAERVIASIPGGDKQAQAMRDLASSLVQAQQWQEAERVVASMQHRDMQAQALSTLASSLVQVQQWQAAERVIASIPGGDKQARALIYLVSSLAEGQQWPEAERVIASIPGSDMQARALSDLASSLAKGQQWPEAKRIIASLQGSDKQARAVNDLVSSLAQAQQWQEAERVIASIQDSDSQAEALSSLASSLAQAQQWETLLGIIQRLWKSTKTNQEALSLFPLALNFISIKPQLGTKLHDAFVWVDDFLRI